MSFCRKRTLVGWKWPPRSEVFEFENFWLLKLVCFPRLSFLFWPYMAKIVPNDQKMQNMGYVCLKFNVSKDVFRYLKLLSNDLNTSVEVFSYPNHVCTYNSCESMIVRKWSMNTNFGLKMKFFAKIENVSLSKVLE